MMNRKSLLRFTAVLGAISVLTSCLRDSYDSGAITEERLQELAAQDPERIFRSKINGLYSNVQSYAYSDFGHNYFGQKSFDYLSSLMGNDMIMTGRYNMSLLHHILQYRSSNLVPTYNRWYEYYTYVASANEMLATIGKIENPSDEVLSYKAIALTFRGYAYEYLSVLYSFCYKVGAEGTPWEVGADHSSDPCVPLVTENTEGYQPRATQEKIYERITADLEEAMEIFSELGRERTPDPCDIDGCVAATYLARAYMNMQRWDDALRCAQMVIDNFEVLDTREEILQGFSDINLPDVVWGCEITSDNTTNYRSWFSQMDCYGSGYAGIGVTRAAFKPFLDRISVLDVRKMWWCCSETTGGKIRDTKKEADVSGQSVKFIGVGRENIIAGNTANWNLGDYIYLRSEEAWFVKAEALAHKNKLPDAASVLRQLMLTRNPSYTVESSDKATLIEEINFQKRVEFWGEGIEYLDNRRLNIPIDRSDETWGKDNNHLDGCKISVGQEDDRMRYQIPDSEMENNSALNENDQNP